MIQYKKRLIRQLLENRTKTKRRGSFDGVTMRRSFGNLSFLLVTRLIQIVGGGGGGGEAEF